MKRLFIVILCCAALVSRGNETLVQQEAADSLRVLLNDRKPDTVKVLQADRLWNAVFRNSHNDSLMLRSAKAIVNLSRKLRYPWGEARGWYDLGRFYHHAEKMDSSVACFDASIALALKLNNKELAIQAYTTQGRVYRKVTDFVNATNALLHALKLAEEMRSKAGIANSYNELGNICNIQNKYRQAISYHRKALALRLELRDSLHISHSYFNLGENYQKANLFDSSFYFLNKALEISRNRHNEVGEAYVYESFATIYNKKKEFARSLEYASRALTIIEPEIEEKDEEIDLLEDIGRSYNGLKQYDKAIAAFLKALSEIKKYSIPQDIAYVYSGLSEAYEGKRDFVHALEYYKTFKKSNDSIFNNENAAKVSQLEIQYAQEKKDKVRDLEEKAKEADHEAQIRQKNIISVSVGIGMLLVVVFSIFIFNRFRLTQRQKQVIEEQKRAVEEQKKIVEEKNKDILDSIHYAQRIQNNILPTRKYIDRTLKRLKN